MNSSRTVKNLLGAVARINEIVIVIALSVAASLASLIVVEPSASRKSLFAAGSHGTHRSVG